RDPGHRGRHRGDRRRPHLGGCPDPRCPRPGRRTGDRSVTATPLPMLASDAPRTDAEARERLERIAALSTEVRELARQRGAVILAHHYQVPEVQDVADYVGDSLGLARRAASTG